MDEPSTRPTPLRLLLVLLLLAASLRGWQLARTEVATRDSIAYIRYAWQLEHQPLLSAVRTNAHHPAYPALVRVASVPVRAAVPDDLPFAMQLAAQLVSCVAGVLLVVPMFYLGRELFDSRVGFWAALLFQVLPASGRLMADGLTEPLFLLLASTALLAACRAVRGGNVAWYAAAGSVSGLAYLTRAEGLLIAGVTGAVLVGLQSRRRAWGVLVRDGAALAAATLLVAAPYMLAIGGLTNKPSAGVMQGKPWAAPPRQAQAVHSPLPVAAWNYGPDIKPEDRYGWAAGALATSIDAGFFHVLTLPFLAGLVVFRRRPLDDPGSWVPLTLMLVLLPLLYRLGQSNGYLGERHVMLVVLCGLYWAVAAVLAGARWLARWTPRVSAATWATAALVVLAVAPLPRTLARLHGGRAAFRDAGRWLAANVGSDAPLVDPFAYPSYFAGETFSDDGGGPEDPDLKVEYARARGAAAYYVILEEGGRSDHGHMSYLIEPARRLAKLGEPVCSFKAGQGWVVVYRVGL